MEKPLSSLELSLFLSNLPKLFGTNYEEFVQVYLNSICNPSDVMGLPTRSPIGNVSKDPDPALVSNPKIGMLIILSMPIIVIIVFGLIFPSSAPTWTTILGFLVFTILILIYNIYIHFKKTKRYIKKYGEEYFRIIVRQTIELCLIRRYFGLFDYDRRHPFEKWYSFSVVHLHLPPRYNFTGRIKSYWNKDKDIKYNIEFKNGNEYGIWKAWYKNGQIAYEQNFKITEYTKSGIRHGKARCWNKKGKIIVDLNYIDGKVSFEK